MAAGASKIAFLFEYLSKYFRTADACLHGVRTAIVAYARDVGKWLKVAGGEKSKVLAPRQELSSWGFALELGAYIGYTVLLLANLAPR